MPAWTIVYGDYSIWDGDPWSAPATNVQAIIVPDPDHGYELLYGGQGFYIYSPDDETWRMADDWFALHDYLCLPGAKRVLFGRTLAHGEWRDLHRFAEKIAGEKTGRWPRERP